MDPNRHGRISCLLIDGLLCVEMRLDVVVQIQEAGDEKDCQGLSDPDTRCCFCSKAD